ncbi:hypothetical protein [Corallococcus sp. CA047B]|uniref:hypothetical protein n=1 Tax=Corallococcus sp. CA047B TaxID=2316729 RepID=UPI0018F4AEF7|nr:hypothetical protein [Corallococcus sp. CA047B]
MATSKRGLVEQVKRAVARVGTRGARALVETALGTASATVRTVDTLQAKLGRKVSPSRRKATTVRKVEAAQPTPSTRKAAPARKAAPVRKAAVRKTGSKVVAAPAAAKRRTAKKGPAVKTSAPRAKRAAVKTAAKPSRRK